MPIDGAHLEVFEPQSPSIHYVGQAVPLLAEVRDVEDLWVDFEPIVWTAAGYDPTLMVGSQGEVELAPGYYDVVATARLPDGQRLESTVGGVRVQTRWSGIYAGDVVMALAVEFQGFPLSPTCVGALDMRVDYDGEQVQMEAGTCALDVFVLQLEGGITLTGEFENGTGHGTIDYDLGGFLSLSFEWTGGFVEDRFVGTFGGPAMVPLVGTADVTGYFDAPLRSPWLDP
jgi:hypothetical protein